MHRLVSRTLVTAATFAGVSLAFACSSAPTDGADPSLARTSGEGVKPLDSQSGDGGACSCSGQGQSGPVTVACGQTTIGTDGQTYLCNAPGGPNGWAACSCSGTSISGPVTIGCGQTTCGTDSNTYVCNAPGGTNAWALQSTGCGSCQCTGMGLNGPVTATCGQSTIGTDTNLYTCDVMASGASTWAECTCSGTSINGPVTVGCGHTTCGTDSNTYACRTPGANGWVQQSTGCAEAANAVADGYFTLAQIEVPPAPGGLDQGCSMEVGPAYPPLLSEMGCTQTMTYRTPSGFPGGYIWMCPSPQFKMPPHNPIIPPPGSAGYPEVPTMVDSACVGTPPAGWKLLIQDLYSSDGNKGCPGGCPWN